MEKVLLHNGEKTNKRIFIFTICSQDKQCTLFVKKQKAEPTIEMDMSQFWMLVFVFHDMTCW